MSDEADDWLAQAEHIKRLRSELSALKEENERLRKVGTALRDDLLERAEESADGVKIVNAGASVWCAFKDSLSGGDE